MVGGECHLVIHSEIVALIFTFDPNCMKATGLTTEYQFITSATHLRNGQQARIILGKGKDKETVSQGSVGVVLMIKSSPFNPFMRPSKVKFTNPI